MIKRLKTVFKFTRLHREFFRDNKLWISSTFYLLATVRNNSYALSGIKDYYIQLPSIIFWSEFVILEEPDKSAHTRSAKEKSNKDKGVTHPHVL